MNQWWTKLHDNDHERVTSLHMERRLGGRYIEEWDEDATGFRMGTIIK